MSGSAFEPIKLPDQIWRDEVTIAILRARDVGRLFHLAKKYAGASQNRIAAATGVSQGRVNALMKRTGGPILQLEVFERIADGLNMPDHARIHLGLAPRDALQESPQSPVGTKRRRVAIFLPVVEGAAIAANLRELLKAHIHAEAGMGSLFLISGIEAQIPLVELLCQTRRGSDRLEVLNFSTEFFEFCGWLYQDAGLFDKAMHWTTRALDHALELGDPRVTTYVLMRRSDIAADLRDPGHALSLADTALKNVDELTPRLKAVSLRCRAKAHAMLGERSRFQADSEDALAQAVEGSVTTEDDRADYCSPAFIEMEVGASLVALGQAAAAIPARTLCLARLATAYAMTGEPEQARDITSELLPLAQSLGSTRVLAQLKRLQHRLTRWSRDPATAELLRALDLLTDPSRSQVPQPEEAT
jgi:transcriptional regulator with XRE-family HTH domain